MKYIRTKEGIYEIVEQYKLPINDDIYYITDYKNFYSYEIIKEADTIKELCDMFVVKLEEGMPVEMPLTEKEQYEKMKKVVLLGTKAKMNIWLKLAIWTEKGLIYVAKMNEKGELELL